MVVDVLARALPLLVDAAEHLEALDDDLDTYERDVQEILLIARRRLSDVILDLEDTLNELT